MLGHGLVVSNSTVSQRPDLIRRFLEASLRGWQEARSDPKRAVQDTLVDFPMANAEFLEAGWSVLPNTLHTANSAGKPLGWMADADWKETLDILSQYANFKGSMNPSDYYTNDFLPAN